VMCSLAGLRQSARCPALRVALQAMEHQQSGVGQEAEVQVGKQCVLQHE
jgi:hypothetical protein